MSETAVSVPQLCDSFLMLLGLIAVMLVIALASPPLGALLGVLSNALPLWCMSKRASG